LAALVGEKASDKLWAQLDPAFSALKASGQQQGLSHAEILEAYDIISTSNQAILEARQLRAWEPEAGLDLMRQAVNDRREKLAQQRRL